MVYLNLKPLLEKHGRSKYWLNELLSSNYTIINNMLEHRTTAISFKTMNTLCTAVDGKEMGAVELVEYLNKLGGENGIGLPFGRLSLAHL